jgi:hypothetical protein
MTSGDEKSAAGGMHMRIIRVTGAWLVAPLLLSLASSAMTAAQGAMLVPTIVYVPEQFHTGGAYTAIQAAPDGRVYIGTTIYDGYAHLVVFTPASGRFESVAEMSAATGERHPGPFAQAKVHTKPAIAPDGRVYFGTKSGKPSRRAEWQQHYPGGHLLVYDPRSGTTTDLGIIKPRESIIAVGVDAQRGLVYALTDPENHLVIYNLRTRTFTDRGLFGPADGEPTRYLVVLNNGDAFHVLGPNQVARYNAAAGLIERLGLTLSGPGTYEPPYALSATSDGRRFVGVGNRSGQVAVFEPRERDVSVRLLGAAIPAGFSPPGRHYTMAAAPDEWVYYTGAYSSGGDTKPNVFICRVSAERGQLQIVGRMAQLPPPPPGYSRPVAQDVVIQGSTFLRDGTLILMGAYPLRLLLFQGLAGR